MISNNNFMDLSVGGFISCAEVVLNLNNTISKV